jgi:hypothetical protein
MAGSGNSCGALKVCVDRSCIDAYLEAKDALLAHRAHVEGPCQTQVQASGSAPILKCRVGRGCKRAS